jgi:hypothetical protein
MRARELEIGDNTSFDKAILVGAIIAKENALAFAAARADMIGSGFLRPQLDDRIKILPDNPPLCWGQ